jgi:hypothetical protein
LNAIFELVSKRQWYLFQTIRLSKKTDEINFLMVKKTNDDFKSLEVGAKKSSMKVVK